MVPSHDIYRCLLTLKKVLVYFLGHDDIFGGFKDWEIVLKKETGKQKGLGGWMRCGWMVRMVVALHVLAH